ncbi:MAG: ATP-binding cassette domain-containing protein [Oscillatoriales cyanobacterium RM2_1_1]|nr:ATP-binding cassette domain-containing protein [Oscillatoriales cyanobacterium SM2_3_0]NJO46665.1 ATP-binding cassette domain-containing protein [Oscillatoriales cyanobacterium RM2_1_1]
MALLKAVGLGRKINSSWLWQGLNLTLEPGTRLAIVGPSGVGKSLLLRSLAGLDPLDAGQVFYQGQRVLSATGQAPGKSMPHYRSAVIYLHQRPALLEGTVDFNLQVVYGFGVHQRQCYNPQRIQTWLDMLGRPAQFLTQAADHLSGGESQIVALLRALQLEPQILLLDEPGASLDPDTTLQMETLIDQWLGETPERACIWTSHDGSQIQRVTTEQFFLSPPEL